MLLTYNDVKLPYSLVKDFTQEATYDESQTDRMCTRFNIQVQCILNTAYLSIAGVGGGDVGQMARNMRAKLMVPGRDLSCNLGGVELIPSRVLGDAQNGPHPRRCVLTDLTNQTVLMTFHVEASYVESADGGTGGNTVLTNRWSEGVDFNYKQQTTRTRRGKYTIRSDNPSGLTADQVRTSMAVIGCPPGFLRESSNYMVSPDGLSLTYSVRDVEQFKMPPAPAYKASGTYTESTTKKGHIRWGAVQVRLEGDNITDQAQLLNTAFQVASSKLQYRGAATANNAATGKKEISTLEECSVSVGMYENWVEVRMKSLLGAVPGRINGVAGLLGNFCNTPLSDGENYNPQYFARGTATMLLQAAAYFDPALAGNAIDRFTAQMTQGNVPGTGRGA